MINEGFDVVAFLKEQHEQIRSGFEQTLASSGEQRKSLFFALVRAPVHAATIGGPPACQSGGRERVRPPRQHDGAGPAGADAQGGGFCPASRADSPSPRRGVGRSKHAGGAVRGDDRPCARRHFRQSLRVDTQARSSDLTVATSGRAHRPTETATVRGASARWTSKKPATAMASPQTTNPMSHACSSSPGCT